MPVPSYFKVLTLGQPGTEKLFDGEVVVQEKLDGSQFGFGFDRETGELCFRSHNQQIDINNVPQMFQNAVSYITNRFLETGLTAGQLGLFFYCEMLNGEGHNVIKYKLPPKNGIMLFDVLWPDGRWGNEFDLRGFANTWGIDYAHTIDRGVFIELEIRDTLESAYGATHVEGLVLKNYSQLIEVNGQVRPIFAKVVRAEYKEKHAETWGTGVNAVDRMVAQYTGDENRWRKVIEQMNADGELTHSPQDIGPLMNLIRDDFLGEEAEHIKRMLFSEYSKRFIIAVTKGFPEWYKAQLQGGLNGAPDEQ